MLSLLLFLALTLQSMNMASTSEEMKGVYDHFTQGGINSGLTADSPGFFKLNGKDIRIISGALHYFRVHPALWRDRLKKLRAAGLNTVETYVPWNLHEPMINQFDFGNGDNEFTQFLDVRRFIKMAQEEDLLVLFRPGPYICSEWDFGGLPSYLLRDSQMKVRTSYRPFLDRVSAFFNELLPRVSDLQFTQGGPIIAIQIENEYGSFTPIHKTYLEHIKNIYDNHGFTSLQFTSDGPGNGANGGLPDKNVLITANFQSNPKGSLDRLLEEQPNRPTMVMEYWSGWFDHWFEQHHEIPLESFGEWLEGIFTHSNTSVNFYMFHGGTNFGFMAGANKMDQAPFYAPDVTSYDYNAPLSESGDYTDKYYRTRELAEKYEVPKLVHPPLPAPTNKFFISPLKLDSWLPFQNWLDQIPETARFKSQNLVSMENLDMNDGSGQSYGYILYETELFFKKQNAQLIIGTPVRDFGLVLLDGKIQGRLDDYWLATSKTFNLTADTLGVHQLTILVENTGRVNFGRAEDFIQHKGLTGTIKLDSTNLQNFTIYAAEFKSKWVQGLENWSPIENYKSNSRAPAIFKTTFTLDKVEGDTFLDMSKYHKGIVFINGFNLGRYFRVGPQQTLYLPGPFLKVGLNTIIIFEMLEPSLEVRFSITPNLGKDTKIEIQ